MHHACTMHAPCMHHACTTHAREPCMQHACACSDASASASAGSGAACGVQRSASSNCARGGGAAPASVASSTCAASRHVPATTHARRANPAAWLRGRVRVKGRVGLRVRDRVGLGIRVRVRVRVKVSTTYLGVVQLGGCHLVVEQRRPLALRLASHRAAAARAQRRVVAGGVRRHACRAQLLQ